MALVFSISNRPFAALAQAFPLSKLPVSPPPLCFALSHPFPRPRSFLSAPSPLAFSFSSLLGRNPHLCPILSPALQLKPSGMAGSASATAVTEKSLHDFSVKDINGKDVELSAYKGKVLLVVNVASRCGLTTSNYTELSQLYDKFKGQDFEILAFPCNQFGGQEPGTNEQIKEFACSRFKAEFPIFDKVEVNGANTAPVYKFLKSSKTGGILGGLLGDNIKWNFAKFLVDKNGQVVQRYAPTTSPLQIEDDIKKLLDS